MSIRASFVVVFGIVLIMLGFQVHISRQLGATHDLIIVCESRRYQSYKLADELRQSSDELTRMARTYVVTGDEVFERYFHAILDIRNGKKPRPAGYDGIYWDFLAAERTAPDASGPVSALEDMMRGLEFTETEFAKLREARENSDALVQLETQAMAAVKGLYADDNGQYTVQGEPNPKLARELMHGPAYHQAKAEIMRPIEAFFDMLESRTATEVAALHDMGRRLATTQLSLAIVSVVVVSLFYVFLEIRVVHGLRKIAGRLSDIVRGHGDLTKRVDQSRRDEIGTLGRHFNEFIQQVHDIVARVRSSTIEVASAATQIAATAREENNIVTTHCGWTSQAAAAVREINATSQELNGTVQQLAELTRTTADRATGGRDRITELDAIINQVALSTQSVTEQLMTIRERSEKISLMVNTIIKVADQTDILSVNAELEAEKAGTHGRGFGVVAEEIRRLADQTSTATLEVESSVSAMSIGVAEGVKNVAVFSELVAQGVAAAAHVGKQLGSIISDVETLGTRFDHITEGVAAQATGAGQISESVSEIDRGATQITASIQEFTQVTHRLQEIVAGLQAEVGAFTINNGRAEHNV